MADQNDIDQSNKINNNINVEEQNKINTYNEQQNEKNIEGKKETFNNINTNENNINNDEKKEEKEIQESKLNMIIKSLKEKDDIIISLQNDINNLKKQNEFYSSQIKEIKESQEQMKQNYEKQINELKEIMAKKEDIKYFAKRRELDYIKENLEALSDKYNNFERVTESKIGFIESNMSKVLEKGEDIKALEKNKIINDNYIDVKKDYFQKEFCTSFDKDVYKELNDILDIIFSKSNLVNKTISENHLDKLIKISTQLFKNRYQPVEYFSEYFNAYTKTINENILKEFNYNLQMKKSIIFQKLNKLNNEVSSYISSNQKNSVNVDIKNFDIKKFRKEYNLPEEDFPDEVLKGSYIANNGNLKLTFYKLVEN